MRKSLVEIVGGFDPNVINEKMDKYQFFKDDGTNEQPVEIDADDEDDADEKIEKITGRRPDKVTKWRVTKKGERVEEADDWGEEELSDEGDGPDDYDGYIRDGRGGTYEVSINNENLGTASSYDEAVDMLVAWMRENKYQPTVWLGSDHGNYEPDSDFPWDRVSMNEENTTSNLDGGLGQPKIPHAFQRTKPTRKDRQKEYENATSSTGYGVVPKSNKYFAKLESMRRRMDTLAEATVVGLSGIGNMHELKARTSAEQSRERVALNTLKMPDAMAGVMGGMSKDEAAKILLGLGYSNNEIKQLSEARYKDWATDPASTPSQKINRSIQEVNRKLYEIEQLVNRSMKLKTEAGLDQDVFWKQTVSKFNRISERMLRVGNKLRELNK